MHICQNYMEQGLYDPDHKLLASYMNFMLLVADRKEAIFVSFAMKLLAGTQSGPYIGFSRITKSSYSVHFLTLCPYWGGNFLILKNKEISTLRILLIALNNSKDNRLEMIIEKYLYAESLMVPRAESRFLEFAFILEMLFLPEKETELSYRFQIRVAKWFKRHYREDVKLIAMLAKRIYTVRSEIAHKGKIDEKRKFGEEDIEKVRNLTRKALRKFVLEPTIFENNYLDELCLQA